jgi:hypothetical protein
MKARPLILLVALFLAIPATAQDTADVPAKKTWEVQAPSGKDFAKLPMTGPIPNNWQQPDKNDYKSGYLTKKEQLAELWKALGQKDPVPDVDFEKESVVMFDFRASTVVISNDEDGKSILCCRIGAGRVVTLCSFPKKSVEAVLNSKK